MAGREGYKTPARPRGPRATGVDPRPGEDRNRGGQKSNVGDPDGMTPTEPKTRRQEGADFHQPIRGNEPADGEGPGDPVARGERRPASKTRH